VTPEIKGLLTRTERTLRLVDDGDNSDVDESVVRGLVKSRIREIAATLDAERPIGADVT